MKRRSPRLMTNVFLIIFLTFTVGSLAQSSPSAAISPRVALGSGFVSTTKYTNAFFGFSLPLPQTPGLASFSEFKEPFDSDKSRHFLFGLKALSTNYFNSKARLTLLTVIAGQSTSASSEEVREAASGPKGKSVTRTEIGGKEFWRSESEEKTTKGTMRNVVFATALDGYVLQFNIASFDGKLTDQLERSIEAITFFDPAKAADIAGPESLKYSPAVSPVANPADGARIGGLDPGAVSGSTYTNNALGFTREFPVGWIVNDKAAQEHIIEAGHQFADGFRLSDARGRSLFQRCAQVLLFATKYPEGVNKAEVNPLVFVIVADPACFPDAPFPTSVLDRDAIEKTTQQFMGAFAGTPFVAKWQDEAAVFAAQGHLMVDVSGSLAVDSLNHKLPLAVFTSCIFTETKGYWVAWGFESGSPEELRKLKKAKIGFASSLPLPYGSQPLSQITGNP